MNRIVTILFLLIGYSALATEIPGGDVSGVWTPANNPYEVLDDIRVAEGDTLIIEPGVEVLFSYGKRLRINGSFHANGAPGDSITFTAAPGINQWNGFIVDSLAASSDTVRFNHCKVSNMGGGKFVVNNDDRFILEDSRLFDNIGHFAGMLRIYNSSCIIRRNRFQNNQTGNSSDGGAIYLTDCNPLIDSNEFIENSATYSGGAISVWRYDTSVTPIISNNLFQENFAASGAAIVLHSNVTPIISNNVFRNNITPYDGGAIWQGYIQADTVRYYNNLFDENETYQTGDGGAIRIIESKVSFNGDVFVNNLAQNGSGSAIHANEASHIEFKNVRFSNNVTNSGTVKAEDNSVVNFRDCVFTNNTASSGGGALSFSYYVESTLTNCLFANNTGNHGGAMHLSQFSHPHFINCTFANNSAETAASVVYLYWDSDPVFTNCVFHGNESTDGFSLVVQDYIWNTCEASFDHCLFQGGQDALSLGTSSLGLWNEVIDEDPLFILPSANAGTEYDGLTANWRFLAEESPCIDAGNSEIEDLPTYDLDGEARIQGLHVDLGAYEGGETISPPEIISLAGPGLLCFPDTAMIDLSASGTDPLSYQWYFNDAPLADQTESSLEVHWAMENGEYWCEVSNLAGTVSSGSFNLTTNEQISDDITILEEALCSGDPFLVDLQFSGGTPDFSAMIDDEEVSLGNTVLDPGSYEITVTDAVGCEASFNLNLEPASQITFEVTEVVEPTCLICNDGAISFTASGNEVTVFVNGEEVSASEIAGLLPGTYEFMVVDSLGCAYTETITLDDDDDNSEIDFNGDGEVTSSDLLEFIGNFGCIGEDCVGDLNGDGVVNVFDLMIFLNLF